MPSPAAEALAAAGTNLQAGFKIRAIGIIVYLFLMCYLNISLGGPDSMNLILPTLERTFGWAPPEVAMGLGIVRLIGIIAMFAIGTLFIKVGITKILVPCTVINGVLVVVMGNVTTMEHFIWVNIAIGIVGPAAMVALGALTANWFVRTRGRVLGIITICFPLSTASFTWIGTHGIESLGYQGFYTAVGVVFAVVGFAGIWLVSDSPEKLGLSPDGIPFTDKEKADIEARKAKNTTVWTLKRIVTTKEIWAYSFAWSLIGLVLGSVMSQMIPVFTSTGITIGQALGMMAVGALAGIPLSYVWGWLDDKIGTPKTVMAFTAVLVTGALGMAFGSAENIVPFYLAIVCIALGSAGMPNLQPSSLAYMVGRNEFMNIQRYFGVIQAVFMGVAMAYVPVTYAYFGSYKPVFLSLIGFIVLTLILLQFTKKTFDPERAECAEGNESN